MLVLGNTKVSATIRRLVFPRVGDSSSAYAWAFTIAGIRIVSDLVLFETGRYGGYISYADLGAPATSTVVVFRASGGSEGAGPLYGPGA